MGKTIKKKARKSVIIILSKIGIFSAIVSRFFLGVEHVNFSDLAKKDTNIDKNGLMSVSVAKAETPSGDENSGDCGDCGCGSCGGCSDCGE